MSLLKLPYTKEKAMRRLSNALKSTGAYVNDCRDGVNSLGKALSKVQIKDSLLTKIVNKIKGNE